MTMMPAVVTSTLILGFVALVVAYLWPRPEVRAEKLMLATVGALLGSLVGRVLLNPAGLGHLLFITGGACIACTAAWIWRPA
jgi:hypothetical protein